MYKQAKAQDKDSGMEAQDEEIAKDMDLGRMHSNDDERFCDQG